MRVDEFDDHGFFWLPHDASAEQHLPGTLRVSALGATTLETFGLADGEPNSLASDLTIRGGQATRRIPGVTRERRFVTLEGCLRTGSNIQVPKRGAVFDSATYTQPGCSIPSAWEETKEAQMSQHAYAELSTYDCWTADEATQRVMWFRDFLRLATDQSVAVTGLTGYSRDATESSQAVGERESARAR